MEIEQPTIKKIIATIDDEKSYSIDVDETTTFYEFKKILSAAAHFSKTASVFTINNKNTQTITTITPSKKCSPT